MIAFALLTACTIGSAAVFAAAPAASETEPAAATLTVQTVDGRSVACRRLVMESDGRIIAECDERNPPGSVDDIASIAAAAAPPVEARPTPVTPPEVHFADGGRLRGRIVDRGQAPRSIVFDAGALGRIEVPLSVLAAIRFSDRIDEKVESEFQQRLAGDRSRDCLIVSGPQGPTALPGALEDLDATTWEFRFGQRKRREALGRAYGVVLGGEKAARPAGAAWLVLRDQTRLSGVLRSAGPDGVEFTLSLGAKVAPAWGTVDRIEFASSRIVYLSDLTPTAEASRGFFGYKWPVRRDRAFDGGALRIGEQTFARGLAVHAYTRLEYTLTEPAERFVATIGLADAAGPGLATFVVSGDGKELLKRGPVRAGAGPAEISVPLGGVQQLVLEVRFGENLDVGDRAVWANARVIRP